MMADIAFIGAGSIDFTRELVQDILTFPLLENIHLALMDINPERLDVDRIGELSTVRCQNWRIGNYAYLRIRHAALCMPRMIPYNEIIRGIYEYFPSLFFP